MKTDAINESDPFVISARVRQEWGRAEAMLREVCRKEEITRTQAIALYGDPRKWKPFSTLPLPPKPVSISSI